MFYRNLCSFWNSLIFFFNIMDDYDLGKIGTIHYYMALSHKDWELPNPRIWLAESDIDRGLDFPIYTGI